MTRSFLRATTFEELCSLVPARTVELQDRGSTEGRINCETGG